MKAFFKQLFIQFKMDFREKGILLTFYLVPLVFYAVMGAVFSSINPDSRQTLAASMIIFAVTMGAVLGIPSPMVKMRESGTLRAFKVSGIPGWSVLLVQAVSAFLHLAIVTVIIFITSPLIFGAEVPKDLLAFKMVLLLLLFSSISLGLLIGSISKSQSAATMLSQLVFLPSLLLGGIMFPASMLPEPLRLIGYALPATHAMEGFRQLAYKLPGTDVGISIILMIAIGIVAAGLTIWRFMATSKTA